MAVSISKSRLKPKLLSYLRKVEQKKVAITVTDRGHPVAQIVPFRKRGKDPLKELRGSVLSYENPLEPVGVEDWELNQ